MKKTGGLGSGVNALFQSSFVNEAESSSVIQISVNDIEPGEGQPRQIFDKDKIEQLAQSIREHGIIQPLIVSREGNIYKIIAGERRWRAARVAGLATVPVIEKNVSTREILELALIENIQREDLNPIEEAEAYMKLIKEYSLTQEKLSEMLGKSRSAIANTIRLLNLDVRVRKMLISGLITEGHARALLALEDSEKQSSAAEEIVNNSYNVRQTEHLIKKILLNRPKKEAVESEENIYDNYTLAIRKIQDNLKNSLGTKVKLIDNKGKGKIVIEYFSQDERERLLTYLTDKKRDIN